jgi:hypothetical protein
MARLRCSGRPSGSQAPRARPQQAALRGDDQVLRVWMQRFGDQLFVHVRAVAVGGVEEIEAQVVRLAQHGVRGGTILRRSPDVGAAYAHRAEAETVDGQVADADGRSHAPV